METKSELKEESNVCSINLRLSYFTLSALVLFPLLFCSLSLVFCSFSASRSLSVWLISRDRWRSLTQHAVHSAEPQSHYGRKHADTHTHPYTQSPHWLPIAYFSFFSLSSVQFWPFSHEFYCFSYFWPFLCKNVIRFVFWHFLVLFVLTTPFTFYLLNSFPLPYWCFVAFFLQWN